MVALAMTHSRAGRATTRCAAGQAMIHWRAGRAMIGLYSSAGADMTRLPILISRCTAAIRPINWMSVI